MNYTGDQPNPGCRATADGIMRLLYAGGASSVDTLSPAYTPHAMSRSLSPDEESRKSTLLRFPKGKSKNIRFHALTRFDSLRSRVRLAVGRERLAAWSYTQRPSYSFVTNLKVDRWITVVKEMCATEHDVLQHIEQADRVVVNGEGTLHHNQRTALTALAIARVAQLMGKEIHVVNATIQAMHPELLRMVLGEAALVVVREPLSLRYLEDLHLDCRLGADCAFAAEYDYTAIPPLLPEPVDRENACLVTGGCALNGSTIMGIIKSLRRAGYSPFYFWIGDGDALSLKRCRAAGIPVVSWDCIPWNTVPAYLKQVKLVVSGRHHMIIFALMAGVPVIPLASNTWKIEGLCELFRWPLPVLSGTYGLVEVLASLQGARSDMAAAFEQVARASLEFASKNILELSRG